MKNKNTKSIKSTNQIHANHRERMRDIYLKNGFDAFSEVEILEYMLFFAIPRVDTNPIAHRLLDAFGSIDNVLEAPIPALMKIEGVGYHTALYLNLMLKVINSYTKKKSPNKISSSADAKLYCTKLFTGKTVEEFYIICLSSSNHIISCDRLASGSVSEVNVQIKDITTNIIFRNCDRIIIAHNHPRGVARPSDEDIAFTCNIIANCIMNDVDVLDHIIVGQNKSFSFQEQNLWAELKQDAVKKLSNKYQYTKFLHPSENYIIDNN